MAIQRYIGDKITCLSTDSKPTGLMDGSDLYELDTFRHYIKSGNYWSEVADQYWTRTAPYVYLRNTGDRVSVGGRFASSKFEIWATGQEEKAIQYTYFSGNRIHELTVDASQNPNLSLRRNDGSTGVYLSSSGQSFITGYLGVGIKTPISSIDTSGQITMRGGSPGLNKVATSDSVGTLSFSTPLTFSITGINQTGNIDFQGRGSVTLTTSNQTFLISGYSGFSEIRVTGSNTMLFPNFTGIGGTLVIRSGDFVLISGAGSSSISNSAGTGTYFFRTALPAGSDKQFIPFPSDLGSSPRVIGSLYNTITNGVIPFQFSGTVNTGTWLILSAPIPDSNYSIDIAAANSNSSGLASTVIVNNTIITGLSSGSYFFRSYISSGVEKQFIPFPFYLNGDPRVVVTLRNDYSNNILSPQISGTNNTGFWAILTENTNNDTGYYLDTIARDSTDTIFGATMIVYSGGTQNSITGNGAFGYIPKFVSATGITNSIAYELSGAIGINNSNPSGSFDVSGRLHFDSYTIRQTSQISNPTITTFDLNGNSTKIVTFTGVLGDTITFSGRNYAPGRECKIFMNVTGSVLNIGYPNLWTWINSRPTGIASGLKAVLSITCTGNSDDMVWSSFGVQV
jgi:hypothetical protein